MADHGFLQALALVKTTIDRRVNEASYRGKVQCDLVSKNQAPGILMQVILYECQFRVSLEVNCHQYCRRIKKEAIEYLEASMAEHF